MTIAPAEQAWIIGWANVNDPDLGYVPMTEATHLARRAAASVEDAPLAWVAETAEQTARRLTLHRARIRLYHKHAKLIVAAMAGLINRVDLDHLITSLLFAGITGPDKQGRRDQVHATLLNSIGPIRRLVDAANMAAYIAATARGLAEAEASLTPGPPDPTAVTAALAATAATVSTIEASVHATDWTNWELSRQAWDSSASDLIAPNSPQQTHRNIKDSLTGLAGVHASAQDLMHGALTAGFVTGIAVSASGSGLVSFQTEEDDKVCPACDAAAANGPYQPNSAPQPPLHPNCRCSLESY